MKTTFRGLPINEANKTWSTCLGFSPGAWLRQPNRQISPHFLHCNCSNLHNYLPAAPCRSQLNKPSPNTLLNTPFSIQSHSTVALPHLLWWRRFGKPGAGLGWVLGPLTINGLASAPVLLWRALHHAGNVVATACPGLVVADSANSSHTHGGRSRIECLLQ